MGMHINTIISLIKSNSNEEAQNLLNKTRKQAEFQSEESQITFRLLSAYFLIKDKKMDEALATLPANSVDIQTNLLRAQIQLNQKKT